MRVFGNSREGSAIGFWAIWQAESRRFILWLPVLMGGGVWLYFFPDDEPPGWTAWLWVLPVGGLSVCTFVRCSFVLPAILWAALSVSGGYALAVWSAERIDAPMLDRSISATVQGRVVAVSRARSGAPRVLLDRLTIFGKPSDETPGRVRLTLLEATRATAPDIGEYVRLYANLFPPGGPVEPGAFNFRRRAFFSELGAVGFARVPHLIVPVSELTDSLTDASRTKRSTVDRARIRLGKLRRDIANRLIEILPGSRGAFAAAIIVGDRSAIEETDAEALRLSNLAHLLAISGLHMGILTGLVFVAMRIAGAAAPWGADRVPTKKIAAITALFAGIAYLMLSGATVATQRALIMVGVFYVAILLDRPAISLRALGLAAALILSIRPVSLLDVGFQMSFAATLALVAGYEELRRRAAARAALSDDERPQISGPVRKVFLRLAVYAGALVLTSALAGAATAPIAAYHFNRTAPWGILANLAAVPAMGFWVAPSAIVAGLSAPFGLEAVPLRVMGAGIGWINAVAGEVASWPGAAQPVRAATPGTLVLVVVGGLWLTLWRGPWRYFGLVGVCSSMLLWWLGPTPRPDVLIAPQARLVGTLGAEGRVLDRSRGQSFAAEVWLRRDGDTATQEEAAERQGAERLNGWLTMRLSNGWIVMKRTGRRSPGVSVDDVCDSRVLLILPRSPAPAGPCLVIDREDLEYGGAVAAYAEGDDLRIEYAQAGKRRRWSPGRVLKR